LENAGICVVGFLDLANNNRLELTPGVLQIEVSLKEISWLKCRGMGDSIPYVNSSPPQFVSRFACQRSSEQYKGLPSQTLPTGRCQPAPAPRGGCEWTCGCLLLPCRRSFGSLQTSS